MTDTPITDEMVEAGARVIDPLAFEEPVLSWWKREQDKARSKARACLEAAMAVRGERT